MKFKDPRVENEYIDSPVMLKVIAEDFELKSREFGVEPVMTRVLEDIPGATGVHPSNRAIDFRDEHVGVRLYNVDARNSISTYINEKYSRDDNKPTLLWHSFNGGPEHVHIQIPISLDRYSDPVMMASYCAKWKARDALSTV